MPSKPGSSFKQPRQRAGKLFLLLALLVLCAGLVLFAVFRDFRTQMLGLLPFDKSNGPSSATVRETGTSFRSPIRLDFKPEPAATPAGSQQPAASQDPASTAAPETEDREAAGPSQGGESAPPGPKPNAAAPEQDSQEKSQKVREPAHEPDTDTRVFSIQAGACRDRTNARYLVEELQAAGYQPVLFRDQHADGEIWYKVRVGEYATQEQAREALDTFRHRQEQNGFLIRITPEAPPQTNK